MKAYLIENNSGVPYKIICLTHDEALLWKEIFTGFKIVKVDLKGYKLKMDKGRIKNV